MDRKLIIAPRLIWLPAVLVLAMVITACSAKEPPSLEEQAQSIDKLLICPVCPAETIDQAQVPLAKDMQAFVREKLAQDWTKQQILDYFSAPERYGLSVLAEPPKSGANLTIWIVPPVGVLVGAILVLFTIRAMQRHRSDVPEEEISDEDLEPYLAQVDAEMEGSARMQPHQAAVSEPEDNDPRLPSTDEGSSSG